MTCHCRDRLRLLHGAVMDDSLGSPRASAHNGCVPILAVQIRLAPVSGCPYGFVLIKSVSMEADLVREWYSLLHTPGTMTGNLSGDKMDIVKDAQKEARKLIITFIIEIILMLLTIFLIFLWFDWKLLVVLFLWQFYQNVGNRNARRG